MFKTSSNWVLHLSIQLHLGKNWWQDGISRSVSRFCNSKSGFPEQPILNVAITAWAQQAGKALGASLHGHGASAMSRSTNWLIHTKPAHGVREIYLLHAQTRNKLRTGRNPSSQAQTLWGEPAALSPCSGETMAFHRSWTFPQKLRYVKNRARRTRSFFLSQTRAQLSVVGLLLTVKQLSDASSVCSVDSTEPSFGRGRSQTGLRKLGARSFLLQQVQKRSGSKVPAPTRSPVAPVTACLEHTFAFHSQVENLLH